ncbi:hypothetical protein DWX43_17020 [Clostridium sp. AF19-22AC]|jgi:4-amino-4-deoxy-L-arabinose transferase-like glycosyltransferase|uniref:ArnT family glycosyltransferase n=1 Tax=Clostridia TaxID=186801 RepID=UPI000E4B8C1F|nr:MULTISPECIES: glycosyltransferase family 39 protein [Clostridia]RHR25827.1 hypothetical protein DWX43_17020 [Clostridium sp. AF19-22AC]
MQNRSIPKSKNSTQLRGITGIFLIVMVFWAVSSVEALHGLVFRYRLFILMMGILLVACVFGYRLWEKKLSEAETVMGIFLLSLLVRGMLVLILPYNLAQHDTHFFGAWEGDAIGSGHFGYIQYLMKFGKLPDFDPRQVWGFYNPPFHHILCALWMKFNHLLGLGYEACAENLQILPLLYTSMTIYTGYRILKEFSLKGRALYFSFGLLAFHPMFAILSLSMNNDPLSILCSVVAVLYTVRWYKEQKMSYILCIALAVGLGMLTKLSVGLLAPAIAFVFLMVLYKRRAEIRILMGQFVCFAVVCVPLGLAWPVRCKLLFDIPFNYVQPLGEGDMWQFVGDYNLWQHLGIPSLTPVLRNPWFTGVPADQHNIWLEMFRTSVLDEWTFQLPHKPYILLATVLVLCGILLGLLTCILFIRMLLKKEVMDRTLKGMFGIGWFGLIGSFVKFTFDYPFICSMNFRYIVPTLFFSVLGTGIWLKEKRTRKTGTTAVIMLGIVFMILSLALLMAYCLLFAQSDVQNL